MSQLEKVEMKHQMNSSWVSYGNLGSVRVVMAADGTAEQVNHYYAFGGLMGDSSGGDVQKYKYNGKELDRFLNWDMLDYGARWYDSKLQCWSTPDPLAEKYYHISPYVYCADNPVNAIDPNGGDIHPVIFRKTDSQGNACGESYLSYVKLINSMTSLGETSYGKVFIGSFLHKGQSQYGVKGTGKNADCILSIRQFGFEDPIDNYMYMGGNNNASFSLSEDEGKLNVVLQIDCSLQNQEEITESLLHELALHGYLVNDIIEAYRNGGIEAAKEVYKSTTQASDHDDLKVQPHVKGGGIYDETAKELINKQPHLQDIIQERRKMYE